MRDKIVLTFSSAFGLGYAPIAPGTFGTFAGLPLWWALAPMGFVWFVVASLVFFGFSVWISELAEGIYGEHDVGKIVIDEVAGLLMTAIAIPFTPLTAVVVFFTFRLFDIVKPFPIRWLDKHVSGGFGVVVDDIVAGLMGCGLLHLSNLVYPWF